MKPWQREEEEYSDAASYVLHLIAVYDVTYYKRFLIRPADLLTYVRVALTLEQ